MTVALEFGSRKQSAGIFGCDLEPGEELSDAISRDYYRFTTQYVYGPDYEYGVRKPNPEPFSVDIAKLYLDATIDPISDPRILWLERSIIFNYHPTFDVAKEALYQHIQHGPSDWIGYANSIIGHDGKDYTDFFFLDSLAKTLRSCTKASSNIFDVSLQISEFLNTNREILKWSGRVRYLFTTFEGQFPDNYDQLLEETQEAEQTGMITKPMAKDIARRIHMIAFQSFVRLGYDEESMYPLRYDRLSCSTPMNIAGSEFDLWIKLLKASLEYITPDQVGTAQKLICDKVVRDLKLVLQNDEDDRYDPLMRYAIVRLLQGFGIKKGDRTKVYQNIPGFTDLPDISPEMIYWHSGYMHDELVIAIDALREEFSTD